MIKQFFDFWKVVLVAGILHLRWMNFDGLTYSTTPFFIIIACHTTYTGNRVVSLNPDPRQLWNVHCLFTWYYLFLAICVFLESRGFAPLTISLRPSSLLLHLITITIKNTITTQINQTLLTNRGIGGKDEITIVLAAEMGDQGWSGSWDTVGFHTHFLFQLLLFDGFVKGLRPWRRPRTNRSFTFHL